MKLKAQEILSLTIDQALEKAFAQSENGELNPDAYESILEKLGESEKEIFTMGLASKKIVVRAKMDYQSAIKNLKLHFMALSQRQGCVYENDYHNACYNISDSRVIAAINEFLVGNNVQLKKNPVKRPPRNSRPNADVTPEYRQKVQDAVKHPNINKLRGTLKRTAESWDSDPSKSMPKVDKDMPQNKLNEVIDTLRDSEDQFLPSWKKFDLKKIAQGMYENHNFTTTVTFDTPPQNIRGFIGDMEGVIGRDKGDLVEVSVYQIDDTTFEFEGMLHSSMEIDSQDFVEDVVTEILSESLYSLYQELGYPEYNFTRSGKLKKIAQYMDDEKDRLADLIRSAQIPLEEKKALMDQLSRAETEPQLKTVWEVIHSYLDWPRVRRLQSELNKTAQMEESLTYYSIEVYDILLDKQVQSIRGDGVEDAEMKFQSAIKKYGDRPLVDEDPRYTIQMVVSSTGEVVKDNLGIGGETRIFESSMGKTAQRISEEKRRLEDAIVAWNFPGSQEWVTAVQQATEFPELTEIWEMLWGTKEGVQQPKQIPYQEYVEFEETQGAPLELANKVSAADVLKMAQLELSPSDKSVLMQFIDRQPAENDKFYTDGVTLDGLWMGGNNIAQWENDKLVISDDLGSKASQTVANFLNKNTPPMDLWWIDPRQEFESQQVSAADVLKDPKDERTKKEQDQRKLSLPGDPVEEHIQSEAKKAFNETNKRAKLKINEKEFTAHIAESSEQKSAGLEVFSSLDKNEGMLFPFEKSQHVTFHMGSVKFPIDILFLMESPFGFEATKIIHNIQPGNGSKWACNNTIAVVEFPGGTCKKEKIKLGTVVEIGA